MRKRRVVGILLSIVLVVTSIISSNIQVAFAEEIDTTTTGSAISAQEPEKENVVSTPQQNAVSDSAIQDGTGESKNATAELRLIYTTDIHGQVTDYDYQTGKTVPRGLNKVYTLIKEARAEVGEDYLTFDIGDSVMNYSTDYIQAQSPTSVQPVYTAMSKIGYDAITLGNHEFDYGYDYLVEQLEGSGLMSKCILSNVTSKVNGNYVLGQENKIIEKVVKDSNGNERTIKIGLFGVTPPCMSSRTEGLRSAVVSEDMLVAAKREAELLKKKGVDIVVALAHTGFGTENPTSRISSTAYAMSKIEDIDVILAGHQHVYFPNAESEEFYKYPGVDKETGLVNGKRLMILRDSCRALGVIDLDFEIDENGKVVFAGSDYEIRKTTENTVADSEITACMDEWDQKIKAYSSAYIGKISDSRRWQNYTSLLEDNEIIQTVQNAQMTYASHQIANKAPEYKDYPIITMARYVRDGSAGSDNYADLTGNIYKGTMADFGSYNCHVYIYEVTGKQVREWLEWGASIYQTVNTSDSDNWDDMVIADFIKKGQGYPLIQNEYQNNWNRLFVFNGIEYTINPKEKPRYNSVGDKINDTQRVTSVTYNGVEITDDQKFALCTEQILTALNTEATEGIKGQAILGSYDLLQDIVSDYLEEKTLVGDLDINVDKNWSLLLPDNYSFIMSAGENSNSVISEKNWYKECVSTLGGYRYYHGNYQSENLNEDKVGPNVVISALNKEETNGSVTIDVMCNDKSGIKTMLYTQGVKNASDGIWQTDDTAVKSVENNAIIVTGSGVYSVYAEDNAGNATVEKIAVTNIYPTTLLKPVVNKVTNKTSTVTGTAEPNTTIYIKTSSKTYKATVAADGTFKVTIPYQAANKVLSAYIVDKKGRTSKSTSITVKRNGPNCPLVSSAKNTGTKITGSCNDKNVNLYAVIGQNVYVSKSLGSSYYKTSKGYNSKLSIKKVNITIKSNGSYTISIPNQYYGTTVKVYSVDKVGRVSGARKVSVSKAAPNRAIIYECTSAEQYVFGRVPNEGVCKVAVKKNNGKYYYGKSDKNGYYAVKVGSLTSGMTVTVTSKIGSGSYSYATSRKVTGYTDIYKNYKNDKVKVYNVTDKMKQIQGKCSLKNSKVYLLVNGKYYTAKTNSKGIYKVNLKSKQKINTCIYVVSRYDGGLIYSMHCRKVVLGAPINPKITSKVKKNTKTIVVQARESCKVVLRVGKKKYKAKKVSYSKSKKVYSYTFKVQKVKSKQTVAAYASNSAGTTKSRTIKVK